MRKVVLVALALLWALPSMAHTVNLVWIASPTAGVTYNVYRSSTSIPAGTCAGTRLSTGVTGLTYTDGTVANGATYFYVVSAQIGGAESACTSQVQVQIPAPPLPPSGLGATVVP